MFELSSLSKHVTLFAAIDMVVLHVKKGDESQFLYETTVEIAVDQLIKELVPIFNGRLKVNRI